MASKNNVRFYKSHDREYNSRPDWQSLRFPFIGTKAIWRILHKVGLFDDKLIGEINNLKFWSLEFTNKILAFLQARALYLTNLVKRTHLDSSSPTSEEIRLFLPILRKEIEIVQPHHIVTFGLVPFENITNKKIKLKDYYFEVMKDKKLKIFRINCSNFKTKLIPCYFPIDRGDRKKVKAVEILKLVNTLL